MVDSAKGKEKREPHVQARRSIKSKPRENVLSEMRKGTKVDEKENEADDWIKTCDIIKQIHIDNPNDIIEKYIEEVLDQEAYGS